MPSSSKSAAARRASAPSIPTSTCAWNVTRMALASCTSPASHIEPRLRQASNRDRPAMTAQNFTIDVDADGIALVTWNMAGRSMNVLDVATIEQLSAIVERVATEEAIKGAVITSGKDTFSGGADLTLLESLGRTFSEMVASQGEEAAAVRLFEDSRKLSL